MKTSLLTLFLASAACLAGANSQESMEGTKHHDKLAILHSAVKEANLTSTTAAGGTPLDSKKTMIVEKDKSTTFLTSKAGADHPALTSNKHDLGSTTSTKYVNVNAQCQDTPGWVDSDGDSCAWYAADAANRCSAFGTCCTNNGQTANDACCVCGGGNSNSQCSDSSGWTDSDGDSCAWYAADAANRCSAFGTCCTNNGQTANDACCVCGGGSSNSQCSDSSGWTDSDGDSCAWYAADAANRCSQFGTCCTNNGQTANDACCVCGGGSTRTDPPPGTTVTYGNQASCNQNDSSRYNICLDLASVSGTVQPWMEAFANARDIWEAAIVGDLSGSTSSAGLTTGTDYTCTGYPASIDDTYICAADANIDGPGRVLGSAGPRFGRNTDPNDSSSPIVALTGVMRFDSADINRLVSDGSFENVILHEMGHVLGIGSLWERNGLYTDGTGVYNRNTNAQREWEAIGCTGRLPVELDGGSGTADGHWDETCLQHELMTGLLTGSSQPMSRITIASLEDIGYTVDYSQADPFSTSNLGSCGSSCPGARRLRRSSHGTVEKKPISDEDLAAVKAYAKSEFEILSNEEPTDLPEGVVYLATDVIGVLWEDDEGIRIIHMTREEAEKV